MKRITIALIVIFSFGACMSGQNTGICAGKIVEKIPDPQNNNSVSEKNIEGANVFLFLGDSLIESAMTNDEGVYEFDKLKAGTYTIKIEFAGYKKQEIKNVKVWQSKVTLVRRTYLVPVTGDTGKEGVIIFQKKKK